MSLSKVKRSSYKSLTLNEKVKIIEEVERGSRKKSAIAAEYGIPANTLSTYLKNKEKILQALDTSCKSRKRVREPSHPDLDECVIRWFTQARDKNVPVSGYLIRAKAEEFGNQLGLENFKASTGWLNGFKERNDLRFRSVCGEDASVNEDNCSAWFQKLPKIIEDYEPKDVFNADETGLFFKCVPEKTFTFKGDSCSGGKKSKERVTVLVGANMDGSEKLPLLMIGKSAKPRCFAKVKSLPVEYASNQKAWMTCDLFEKWLMALDKKFASKKRKVLLFLDNCTAHNRVPVMKSIKVVFFPPNMTSRVQPMDQGVIKNLKHFYRRFVVCKILNDMENDAVQQSINLLDASRMISRAWREVTQATIANCFRKAAFRLSGDVSEPTEVDIVEEFQCAEWNELFEKELVADMDFETFACVDENVEVCGQISDAEIFRDVTTQKDDEVSDDEMCRLTEEVSVPNIKETLSALDILRRFTESQDTVDGAIFKSLDAMESFVAERKAIRNRQKKLTEFFQLQ